MQPLADKFWTLELFLSVALQGPTIPFYYLRVTDMRRATGVSRRFDIMHKHIISVL